MKICLLASAINTHTQRWVRYLVDQKHSIHVVTLHPRVLEGATVHPMGGVLPFKAAYVLAALRVRGLLRRIRPDVVHAHYATGYGLLGALTGHRPFVISVWGSDVFLFPRSSPLHQRLLRFNLSRADYVFSTSEAMARETAKYYSRPIALTPFGVDCSLFRPSDATTPRGGDFVIGVVKGLEPKYGIEDLLRTFALVRAQYQGPRRLRLVIAGTGSLGDRLRRVAVELGVADLTQFLGLVPHADVPRLLGTFSLFVCLSHSESFGVSVLEAEASGIPVVVSDVGGLPEVVRDGVTGLVVPARSPASAASAILSLVDDEDRRERMGAAGRQFVLQHYEWTESARRMEALYETVLMQSRPACAPRA
jgi:glycosyltransferase involved in cell wall biosynthesis